MKPQPAALRLAELALLSLSLGVALASPRLSAQTADLVRDINVTSLDLQPISASPGGFLAWQGKLFFAANTAGSGREPWVTDGTEAGTQMLTDVCPGFCSSQPLFLAGVGGTVLFTATSPDKSPFTQLWRSDGTPAGTFALTESPVQLGFYQTRSQVALAGGHVFFLACTGTASGCGLWQSDGTRAGTQPVPGYGGGQARFFPLAAGDRVYVVTSAGEVWVSDGTAAGTAPLSGLPVPFSVSAMAVAGDRVFFLSTDGLWVAGPTGTSASQIPLNHSPRTLMAVGRHAYFAAIDASEVPQLWVTDGTAAGTSQVSFLTQDESRGFGFSAVAEVGSRVLFMGSDVNRTKSRLWASSGIPGSTVRLADAAPYSPLLALGGRAIYAVSLATGGTALWSTDGTPSGSLLLVRGGVFDAHQRFTVLGDKVFFLADDGSGPQLWQSDGTPRGTARFTDLPGSDAELDAGDLALLGGELFFGAGSPYGRQLWKSNGAPGGTELVAVIAHTEASSTPVELTAVGNQLLFSAYDGKNRQLWRSAGTAASTFALSSSVITTPDSVLDGPQQLVPAGGSVFFWLGSFFGPFELWRSDGTVGGTVLLRDFPEYVNTPLVRAAPLADRLFFSVSSFQSGTSLWTSDGTAVGTAMVVGFPGVSTPLRSLTATAGQLFFATSGPFPNAQVYRSDGTPAGTVQLLTGSFQADENYPLRFTAVGNTVFFILTRDTDAKNVELWRTDGTAASTLLVTSLSTGLNGYPPQPSDLLAFGNQLFFFADTASGRALFRSDGTAAGTVQVRAFLVPSFPAPLQHWLTAFGGRLYFVADDGVHGRELWTSDGTPQGTTLLVDILPGALSSDPRWLTVAGGRLWFAADDGVHGFELWQSDGTAAGTRMVQDIAPGPDSSYPDQLTAAGGLLYFTADDGAFGRELWALPLSPEGGGCQPSAARLCLSGNRFRVEVAWRDFQGNQGAGTAVPLTADTGTFWFFDPANVELIAKVLDGRSLNQSFWVFYGALSDVEYTITIVDTATGLTRRYVNPAGQLASVADVNAFGPLGEFWTPPPAPAPALRPAAPAPRAGAGAADRGPAAAGPAAAPSAAPCQAGPTRVCLNGGRFAVEAVWQDFQGRTGTGTAVPLSGDTGYFWFFAPGNVEVVLKVIDGRALNGKFWVFYGALSSVAYTLTVTDTTTGEVRTYQNPLGRLASVADTNAF
jgi:ELWxxDGT repeat protein